MPVKPPNKLLEYLTSIMGKMGSSPEFSKVDDFLAIKPDLDAHLASGGKQRIYRGERTPGVVEGRGQIFSNDMDEVMAFKKQFGDQGQVSYVDVEDNVADRGNIANKGVKERFMPRQTKGYFSSPKKNTFLVKSIAEQKKRLLEMLLAAGGGSMMADHATASPTGDEATEVMKQLMGGLSEEEILSKMNFGAPDASMTTPTKGSGYEGWREMADEAGSMVVGEGEFEMFQPNPKMPTIAMEIGQSSIPSKGKGAVEKTAHELANPSLYGKKSNIAPKPKRKPPQPKFDLNSIVGDSPSQGLPPVESTGSAARNARLKGKTDPVINNPTGKIHEYPDEPPSQLNPWEGPPDWLSFPRDPKTGEIIMPSTPEVPPFDLDSIVGSGPSQGLPPTSPTGDAARKARLKISDNKPGGVKGEKPYDPTNPKDVFGFESYPPSPMKMLKGLHDIKLTGRKKPGPIIEPTSELAKFMRDITRMYPRTAWTGKKLAKAGLSGGALWLLHKLTSVPDDGGDR